MIPSDFLPLANHLWQSTLFAVIAGLLTLLLRKNRAHSRYCLWLAASAKFLVPFSLFVAVGSQFGRHAAIAPAFSSVPVIIEQVHEPFGPGVSLQSMPTPHTPEAASFLLPVVFVLWAAGFGVVVFSWWRQWRRFRGAIREAVPVSLPLALGVPALSSASFSEPGVFGVFHPVLLLPDGIAGHLSPEELEAILTHELCHVRRRDNLFSMMHMIVEAVFWFHPLVWWLGTRLMDERERACDEEVLRTASPEAYAEGILKVCEQYVRSPLACVAGVTGTNLKTRIEAIMNNRPTLKLNFAKRTGLAIAGILAVAIPLIIGITNAPSLRAQAQSDLRFEVASVRRVEIPPTDRGVPVTFPTGGIGTSDPRRFTYRGAWLPNLITQAFGVRHDQITGPDWLRRERYDIVALIPEGATKEQFNIMLGNLLRDRFHLRFHVDSKTIPVYALRVAKDGPKFKETARRASDATAPTRVTGERDAQGFIVLPPDRQGMISIPLPGEIFTTAQDVPMSDLAGSLESRAGRPVVDETGLAGRYDFKLHHEYIRRAGDALVPAPTVFDAVEQQLGLKLESATKSFPQLIIDSIDREPTDN
jgi:bla regulator protein BlaR1